MLKLPRFQPLGWSYIVLYIPSEQPFIGMTHCISNHRHPPSTLHPLHPTDYIEIGRLVLLASYSFSSESGACLCYVTTQHSYLAAIHVNVYWIWLAVLSMPMDMENVLRPRTPPPPPSSPSSTVSPTVTSVEATIFPYWEPGTLCPNLQMCVYHHFFPLLYILCFGWFLVRRLCSLTVLQKQTANAERTENETKLYTRIFVVVVVAGVIPVLLAFGCAKNKRNLQNYEYEY